MNNNLRFLFTLMTFTIFGSLKTNAQNPDNTFGIYGKSFTQFGFFSSYCKSMVLLPDGTIVSVGDNGNTTNAILISKHLSDGNLDINFNGNGKKQISFGSAYEYCNSVIRQPDDKLVLAGSSNGDAALARLLPNGDFDLSFSEDGKLTLSFGAGNGSGFRKVLLQPDGKIIAIGEAYNGANFDFSAARFNADGSVDDTFGTSGKMLINFNNFNDFGRNAILQSDDKMIIAGGAFESVFNSSIALARINTNGTLDETFGTGGKATLNVNSDENDYVEDMAILNNGKILLGGYSSGDFLLMRYNANGTPDNSFGNGGYLLTDFGNSQDRAYAIAVDNNGSIFLGGHGYEAGMSGLFHFAVAKYTSNGDLDNTFDADGKMVEIMGADGSTAYDMVIQPDGKLLLGGQSLEIAGGYLDFGLLRLENTTVGITEDEAFKTDFIIYPNPAKDFITIVQANSGERATLKIYSATGQIVLQRTITQNSDRIELSELPAGLYYITVNNDYISSSFKIIKE
jgi:uncharacterized delta-60 repeat protein